MSKALLIAHISLTGVFDPAGKIFLFVLLFYREWTENGQLWVQQVSSTPATRLDVVNLQVITGG